MIVVEALRAAAERLATSSDTARLDAELLMAHALGVPRSELLLRYTGEVVPEAFAELVERRLAHEPVAYILGTQEFRGHAFRVTPDVLIPRADSEILVEVALATAFSAARILDCGTGSGALLLAVLAELPSATGIGIDRSQAALHVASANAASLGLLERARFALADWTEAGWSKELGAPFDLILANPPYVEDSADLAPSVRDHEPHGALFAGREGLDAYRILVPEFPSLLRGSGIALVEIGATQAAAVTKIAHQAGFDAKLHRDLAGRPRVLELRR